MLVVVDIVVVDIVVVVVDIICRLSLVVLSPQRANRQGRPLNIFT